MLVAVTEHDPAVAGAVNVLVFPLPLRVPHVADHDTLVFTDPTTVAVNCWLPFTEMVAVEGAMLTVVSNLKMSAAIQPNTVIVPPGNLAALPQFVPVGGIRSSFSVVNIE